MTIGERLRFFREQVGISGKYLAEQAGLVPSQIYKIESNTTKPSLDSLERICDVLGITMGEFFADDQAPELSPDIRRLVDLANRLTPKQREILLAAAEEWAGLNQKGE